MQSANADYDFMDRSPSKAIDVAFVIAGHARIYTVCSDDYAIPASSGDLRGDYGFTSVRRYADFPNIDAAKMKGAWPEAGGFSIGSCEVNLKDGYTDAHNTAREFTDLAARASYLEGNQTGVEAVLNEDLDASETTIDLVDSTGLPSSGVVFISQECIAYTGNAANQLTGCTRGYRLTVATPHLSAVTVYGYMPSLYRRICYVYKGYQGIALSSWIRMWGGVIDGVNHSPGMLSIHAMGMAWETYGGRPRGRSRATVNSIPSRGDPPSTRTIVRLGQISDDLNDQTIGSFAGSASLGGDYRFVIIVPLSSPTGLGDGHFALRSGEDWFGIISPLVNEPSSGNGPPVQIGFDVVRGLGHSTYDGSVEEGDPLDLAWSNATFSATAAPGGDSLHPIDLWLKFLLSTTGGGDNHATYDAFKRGIGLAIPAALVDVTSFTDIAGQNDVPSDLATFFLFSKPVPAKPFFDDQLGKPFGWYMATGNDGRIKLVRPKNPVKLYFSSANNGFTLTHSSGWRTRRFSLPAGVYTGTEAAAALQTGLSAVTGQTFTVGYTAATGIFRIQVASGTFTFSASDAWATIGHTTASASNDTSGSAVAIFTDTSDDGDYNTLTEDDLTDVKQANTLDQRIVEVWYRCNYDWSTEEFRQIHTFTDAEGANLDGAEVEPYEIEAKGLLRAYSGTRTDRIIGPFDVRSVPVGSGSCYGYTLDVSSSYGIDASDSFATLFTAHLFDRYRVPPVRFKARLKWKFNRLEVGDNVKITYAIDGVIADYELGSGKVGYQANGSTTATRVFEVISVKPVLSVSGSYIEAEFLGHRIGG